MPVGGRFDQLRGNQHAVARALDRAFDDSVHIQLPRDLLNGFLPALVAHNGRAAGHAQSADVAQRGAERLRHAVAEIGLVGVAGEIIQWFDGQRGDAGRSFMGKSRSREAQAVLQKQENVNHHQHKHAGRKSHLPAFDCDLLRAAIARMRQTFPPPDVVGRGFAQHYLVNDYRRVDVLQLRLAKAHERQLNLVSHLLEDGV